MTDDTTITDSERDLLRFPGDGSILRRTTPITNATARGLPDDADDVYPTGTLTGLVCGVMTDRAIIAWDCCEQWDRVDFAGLALGLTDATGRAHLAWCMARQIRHTFGGTIDPAEGVRWHRSHRGHWELHAQRADEHRRWQEVCFLPWDGDDDVSDRNGGPHATWCRFVPTLATIDPNDPRLLPDGSWLVDALALSLVGRHLLAGGGR